MTGTDRARAGGVRWDREGDVVSATLDRPPLNVLDLGLTSELLAGLRSLREDPPAVLVFRGKGKAFCAGVDVADHLGDTARSMLDGFHGLFREIWSLAVPTVALVQGAALGGGCELVGACDIVVASEGATFGVPEIRLGVFPPVACVLFPRILGWQRAASLILTGRIIPADEARAMGLVHDVVAADRLEARGREWIDELAGLSPVALRLTKKAMLRGSMADLDASLEEVERLYHEELMETQDAREGLTSFLEKRKPRWTGR
jgi:cyclohexa-1,5-dienecarbonyl-CoA hydratase